MTVKMTAPAIRSMKKGGRRIVCVTAYDYSCALLAELAEVDLVLVGDSLGNVLLGYDSTLPVTMEDMVRHTQAVRKGLKTPLLVADMPFGSYQASVSDAVTNAARLMASGAEAVKLEGPYVDEVRACVKAGIPVMGHLGMTPQSVHSFGGHKVQGKGDSGALILEQAHELQDAGVFSLVLELVPAQLAGQLTSELEVPTVGIGAGVDCDGQIQVWHDVLGLGEKQFRHAKAFAQGREVLLDGLKEYVHAVRNRKFPTEENSF